MQSLELKDQYDKVYRYCYFKLNNSDIAEDITQETFLKYYSQASYTNQGKPLAYLYTIAKNLCIDYFRRKKPLSLSDDEECILANDRVSALETELSVKHAVNTLSNDIQEILLLRYANELGINEISEFVGMSRFAVRRKINNALNQLKTILRKEDFS